MAEGGIPPEPKGLAPPVKPLAEGGMPLKLTSQAPSEPEVTTLQAEPLAEGGISSEPKGPEPSEELLAEGGIPPEPKGPAQLDKLLAEGWVPPEPTGPPPPDEPPRLPVAEEIDSLHLLLSRDLLNYVIRRKIHCWNFSAEYACACPCTPFSYRIRQAADWYLNIECVNFETLFYSAFRYDYIDYDGFVRVFRLLARCVYYKVKSYTDLLRLLFLCAQFTLLAYDRGVHMAPYYALFGLKELLKGYCEREGIYPDVFYAKLGRRAQDLIHEETPVVFDDIFHR